MKSYRVVWWTSAIALGVLGVVCAVLLASLVTAVVVFLVTGCSSVALSTAVGGTDESVPAARSSITTGVGTGGAAVALYGLGILLGLAVVPLAAMAAVTSPAFLRWCRSRSDKPTGASEEEAPEDDDWWLGWSDERAPRNDGPHPPKSASDDSGVNRVPGDDAGAQRQNHTLRDVSGLNDEELCMAWRRTFVELGRTSSPEVIADIAAIRQRILDELERRNRDGVVDWLASGARAAGNPAKYLHGGRTQSP